MKRILSHILYIIVFLLILAAAFCAVFRLVERKESRQKNEEFFSLSKDIDVLLLGSSHVIDGINPVQLYEEHGICAYNLAGHGNVLPVSYWELRNALDYCSPSYVVIDVFMLEKDYHYVDRMGESDTDAARESSVSQLHEAIDFFPLSKTKLLALEDLLSTKELRREFIFDFIRYHGRWTELSASDVEDLVAMKNGNPTLGSEMQFVVEPNGETFDLIAPTEMNYAESAGKEYLRRMIELCGERGIQPILICVPFSGPPEYQQAVNSAQLIADEYHIPMINMNYVPDLIDYRCDLADPTHLNAHGAGKVTAYLGDTLSQVGVPDRRGSAQAAAWEEKVDPWHDTIRGAAVHPRDLYSELMALQFDDISSIVFINNNSIAFYDESMQAMIERLVGTAGIHAVPESHRSYCLIHDSKNDVYIETLGDVPIEDLHTSFGVVYFVSPEERYNLLTIGDDRTDNILDYVNNYRIDVQIFVFDNRNGEQIGHLCFDDAGFSIHP